MNDLDPDLVRLLKRLKLGLLVPTLPERLALARAQRLDYAQFLTLLLADEVQRRDQQALERHLLQAGFEDRVALEDVDWTSPVQLDKRQLQHLFTLAFLHQKEHVIFVGPVGVGKTMLAQALGSAVVRAGHTVLFTRADALLKDLGQARADHTFEKAFRRYLAPDLLIVDDFGLHRLSSQQSSDLYELIIERHRRASFAITSNRGVDEWLGLFDEPSTGHCPGSRPTRRSRHHHRPCPSALQPVPPRGLPDLPRPARSSARRTARWAAARGRPRGDLAGRPHA